MAFVKTYTVIGYTYEADIHCRKCTANAFRYSTEPDFSDSFDRNGNEIHPLTEGDIFYPERCPHCSDCREPLRFLCEC